MKGRDISIGIRTNGVPFSVFIVDDSKTARAVLTQMLRSMEFKILDEAEHGEIAIHKIKAQGLKPDFLLIDMEMPLMNGVETIKALKPLIPDARIIMVTSRSNKELVMELMDLGVSGFIKKPYDRDTVLKKLSLIIRGPEE